MLLASQRVVPRRLLEAGFHFEDEELEPLLRKLVA
jgi:NAD dependent epimerase/dehydratase family enzyme